MLSTMAGEEEQQEETQPTPNIATTFDWSAFSADEGRLYYYNR